MPDNSRTSPSSPAQTSPRHPDRDRNADGRPENARPRDRFGAPLPRDAPNELVDRVEPELVCETLDDAHERGVELFNEQRFFEAHEFFEWAWKGPVTPDEDRTFYKGLAQLAVGYTHTQRGNPTGATALLERARGNLSGYGADHRGVDVARATREAEAFAARLDTDEVPGDMVFPAFPAT